MKILWADVESTGLSADANTIHQLAGIVEIDGVEKSRFNLHCAPVVGAVVEDQALAIAGLNRDMLDMLPDPVLAYNKLHDELLPHISKYDKNDCFMIAGWNAHFDMQFIISWLRNVTSNKYEYWNFFVPPPTCLDVMQMFILMHHRGWIPFYGNWKLATVAKAFGMTQGDIHGADNDIDITRKLWQEANKIIDKNTKKPRKVKVKKMPVPKLEDCHENFRDKKGKAYVTRCPSCRAENWLPAVATGRCAWCGWAEGTNVKKPPDEKSKRRN